MISERARIATDEEVMISEQNRERQVLVAERSKQRTDAVETVRVEQARLLENNEKERIVALAQIEKEKAVEEERKNIQGIIRERITVEKAVVEEEEKIKDTKAFAEAERLKSVAITTATMVAEEALVKEIKGAEAARQAAEFRAQQLLIDAEAEKTSSVNRAQAIKLMAEAEATQAAAVGLSEAQVMEAKAAARQKEGEAEANVTERQAVATAKATRVQAEAQAEADEKLGLVAAKVTQEKGMADASIIANLAAAEEKRGLAEARVSGEKFTVEAKGIEEKAGAMKKLDGVGKEHEEFKLRLEKDKAIELAQIDIQKDIAASQASVLSEALKAAKIDIVGGETMFFDQIVGSITKGKQVDRLVTNSEVLGTVKDAFFQKDSNGHIDFKANLQRFITQFGMNSDDVRNLSVSALLLKMMQQKTLDEATANTLKELTSTASALGLGDRPVYTLN
jgi:hypothetical protein